jgi:hypothetical protein
MMNLNRAIEQFFGVAGRGQTYLNALYLLVSFPLGILYFVFLVTGLSLGISLIIVWVGLLILSAVFVAWYGLLIFERQLAIWMLKEDIPPMTREDMSHLSLWQKFVAAVKNPVTWKGLLYLFARFPLGVFSFVVLITLLALSASLLAAPLYYRYVLEVVPPMHLTINGAVFDRWLIDTPIEAALACFAGILVTLGSMHVLNSLAWVSGKFARVMLGNFSAGPTPPAAAAQEILEEPSI